MRCLAWTWGLREQTGVFPGTSPVLHLPPDTLAFWSILQAPPLPPPPQGSRWLPHHPNALSSRHGGPRPSWEGPADYTLSSSLPPPRLSPSQRPAQACFQPHGGAHLRLRSGRSGACGWNTVAASGSQLRPSGWRGARVNEQPPDLLNKERKDS